MDLTKVNPAARANDEREIALSLLASQDDAFEALELADGLLDTCAFFVEVLWEEARLAFLVGLARNDGDDAV